MSRIKTGGRGWAFSYEEYKTAWLDTKDELDHIDDIRKSKANKEKNNEHSETRKS